MNPLAFFDTLYIVARLDKTLGNAAFAEIHLFAYLSCLMSLYARQPVSAWGYRFAVTEAGSPFCTEIDLACGEFVRRGFLTETDGFASVTRRGERELEFLRSLLQYRRRETYLDGACASALALPVGLVREALGRQAELRIADAGVKSRLLLEEVRLHRLHKDFAELSAAIGIGLKELMVPAVIWLNYTLQNGDQLGQAVSQGGTRA